MIGIDWIGFVIASVAIVLAPGPGSLFVARTAGASGLRAGHKAMVGIMVGDTCLIIYRCLAYRPFFRHVHLYSMSFGWQEPAIWSFSV